MFFEQRQRSAAKVCAPLAWQHERVSRMQCLVSASRAVPQVSASSGCFEWGAPKAWGDPHRLNHRVFSRDAHVPRGSVLVFCCRKSNVEREDTSSQARVRERGSLSHAEPVGARLQQYRHSASSSTPGRWEEINEARLERGMLCERAMTSVRDGEVKMGEARGKALSKVGLNQGW